MTSPSTRVLVICDWYLPGYRAGGPIRSLEAIVERLRDELDFTIVCGNRDLGSSRPYRTVHRKVVYDVGGAKVRYVGSALVGTIELWAAMTRMPHEALYINSLFSVRFGVLPVLLRWLRLVPRRRTVVAPRGELSPGARELGRVRKTLYLRLASAAGLYRGVLWHVTSEEELDEVRPLARPRGHIVLAPNLVSPASPTIVGSTSQKTEGSLRLLYLSRISPKKNLAGALKVLRRCNGQISFNIYGPKESSTYWQTCEELIEQLPVNVAAHYKGSVAPEKVAAVVRSHDLFFLPTRGENFGHAIFEALHEGTPVLISDRTPWRGLAQAGAGWDLPLSDEDRFRRALERCVAMDNREHVGWRRGAAQLAANKLADTEGTAATMRSLFASSERVA